MVAGSIGAGTVVATKRFLPEIFPRDFVVPPYLFVATAHALARDGRTFYEQDRYEIVEGSTTAIVRNRHRRSEAT